MPHPLKPEQPDERFLSAEEKVWRRRYRRLVDLQIDPDQALILSCIPDIGAQAETLHAKGCPPHLIVELLKGD